METSASFICTTDLQDTEETWCAHSWWDHRRHPESCSEAFHRGTLASKGGINGDDEIQRHSSKSEIISSNQLDLNKKTADERNWLNYTLN